jgi:hypothetical protein
MFWMLALLCVCVAQLAQPAPLPAAAERASGEVLVELAGLDAARPQRAFVPGTALELIASAREVQLIARDGGAVGSLPLASPEAVTEVRMLREPSGFAIELRQAGRVFATHVDREGVRQDDDLRARLWSHIRPLQLCLLLGALIAVWLCSAPILAQLDRPPSRYPQSRLR